MNISLKFLSSVKSVISMHQIASRVVKLQRYGIQWRGLSPFKKENTPSFFILKDNKHFKCFSTGLFGDIFKFIQYLYKKSYIWSVIYIVNEFNLKLEATQLNVSSSLQNENHELNNQDVKYIKIFYKIIMNFYHQNLMFKKLSTSFYKWLVFKYLISTRGLDYSCLKKYTIGLPFNITKLNIQVKTKTLSNLFYKNTFIFFQRIVIPIKNLKANPVGFTARTLFKTYNYPKYLTIFPKKLIVKKKIYLMDVYFNKSSSLIFVVEGPTDLFQMSKLNFFNIICLLGTSSKIDIFKKITGSFKHSFFIFDYDYAGIEISYKIILYNLYLNKKIKFLIIKLTGTDFDSILNGLFLNKNNIAYWLFIFKKYVLPHTYIITVLLQNNYFKLNPLKIYYIFNYITLASSWNVEIYIHKISYLLGLPYIVLINKYNKYIFSVFKKVKCIFYVYNRVQQNPLDEVCKILLYFYNPKGLLNQLVVFLDFSNINMLLQFKYIIEIKNAPSFLNSTFYPPIYIYNQIKLNLNLYIKDILKSKLKWLHSHLFWGIRKFFFNKILFVCIRRLFLIFKLLK